MSRRLYALSAALLLAGCDQLSTTALPMVPAAASPAPVASEGISILVVQPASGATLTVIRSGCETVADCVLVNFAFRMQSPQDVTLPEVTVELYDGSQLCASGNAYKDSGRQPLPANTPVTFETLALFPWDNACNSQSTTRMVVTLWDSAILSQTSSGRLRPAMILTGEFPHKYTFVLP